MKKAIYINVIATAFVVALISTFAGCSGTENETVYSDADLEVDAAENGEPESAEEGDEADLREIDGVEETAEETEPDAEAEETESQTEEENSLDAEEVEVETEPAEEAQAEYDEESGAETETETETGLETEGEMEAEEPENAEEEQASAAAGLLVYFTNFVDTASARFYPFKSGAFGPEAIVMPTLYTDAAVAGGGGFAFAVERMGADKVTILDVSTDSISPKKTISVGDGKMNAQYALMAAPGKIYVSALASAEIGVYDAESGEKIKGIDLSAFADDKDGLPEIAGMIMVDGKVFAQVQALDSTAYYSPYGPSALAVINPATDELIDADPALEGVQGIKLPARNPNGDMRVIGGLIYVNICENAYSADSGAAGLWTINPSSLSAVKQVIGESALSGGLIDFAIYDETRAVGIISTANFTVKVVAFNPSVGEIIKDVYDNSAWDVNDVKADAANKLFFVATKKAILAFDAETLEEKTGAEPALSADAGQPLDMLVLPAE